MSPYHILITTISLYNKQFHRHFALKKKMLSFVYFPLDDIHVLPVKMAASKLFSLYKPV